MKTYLMLLMAFLLLASAFVPVTSSYAGRIVVQIGDRGYYNHGSWYMNGGRRWCWVPGHWGRHHRWIHGHYRPCY